MIDTQDEAIECDIARTVTGLYVSRIDKVSGNSTDFVDCENGTNSAIFETSLSTLAGYKFDNEYRKLFKPTTAELIIPDYLDLTAVKVEIKNQPWLIAPNNEEIIDVLDLTEINATTYSVNLAAALKSMTEAVLGAGNGLDYLNEAFQLAITPVVSLKGCEPTNTTKEQKVSITLNGEILDGEGLPTPYSNQNTSEVVYNTGIGSLTLKTANNVLDGKLSPDGTEVSWIVKVESEGARNFNSVWFSQTDGVLDIDSVEEITSYGDLTVKNNVLLENGLYKLGDFDSKLPKYYLIKSTVKNCEVHYLDLRVGYNCETGKYPASNEEGCRFDSLRLTHKTIANTLQTEIVNQFNGNDSVKPDLCGGIWYTVRLHNAGDSQLSELQITIPSVLGLVFEKFEYTDATTTNDFSTLTYLAGNPVDADTIGNKLSVKLPASVKLNTLERTYIRVYYIPTCEFKSGSKYRVTPSAVNTCGTELVELEISSATTKRILIEGGSDSFPELATEGITEVKLHPVLTEGGSLYAVYNAAIKNRGADDVNDVLTAPYQISLKLPAGWTIVGEPQDYIEPAGFATYEPSPTNPDPDRGYVFTIEGTLPVGQTLKFKDLPLKYSVGDEITLTCNHDFGNIELRVFQNIQLSNCAPLINCSGNGIDQELYEDILPMIIPLEDALKIKPENQFPEVCNPSVNGGVPTLADIQMDPQTNVFHLDWYDEYSDAVADLPGKRLALSTELENGQTYFVINRFINGGVCKSNIGKIKVTFKENNLSGEVDTICSTDAQTYQVQIELTGEAPFAFTGTTPGTLAGNVWTSEPLTASTSYGIEGTPYDVTFSDANNCSPVAFTGVAPICCTLEITCPVNITIACGADASPSNTGTPQIVKSCGSTTYTYTDSAISAVCVDGKRFFTRTFTVTDETYSIDVNGVEEGNKVTCEQVITIEDKVAPILGNVAHDKTVSCETNTDAALTAWLESNGGATAIDACSGDVTWSNDYDATNFVESCGVGNGSVEVTFTATDACGNEVKTTATFTIEDTKAPVISTTAQALDRTLECSDAAGLTAALALAPVASDNCTASSELRITLVSDVTTATAGCANGYVQIRTWNFTDACGNVSANYVQTITVVDTTAPVITTKINPVPAFTECNGPTAETDFNAWIADNGGFDATDNCGGDVTWSHEVVDTNTTCGNARTIIVAFKAIDACGNASVQQSMFEFKDTTAPTITTTASALDRTLECSDEAGLLQALILVPTALDSCAADADVKITLVSDVTTADADCANGYVRIRTWNFTDACGNVSADFVQTITVVDTTKPVVSTAIQALDRTVECSDATGLDNALALAPVATDNCTASGELRITLVSDVTTADANCTNGYVRVRTWNFTDACGNVSANFVQTITVVDTTAPVFTSTMPTDVTISCALDVPLKETLTASDNCGGTVTITVNDVISNVSPICANNYTITRTYTATDECGNSTDYVQVITISDTTKPEFVEALPENVTYSCDAEVPIAPTLTAIDGCSATVITATFVETRIDNGSCANSYVLTRTWTATDECGNAETHTQVITVADTTAPTFTKKPESVIVECDGKGNLVELNAWLANHGGAAAEDGCGPVFWETTHIEDTNTICGIAGTVIVDFIVKDACGNWTMEQATFAIKDTVAPIIIEEAKPLVIECGVHFEDELNAWLSNYGGAIATDNCGDVTWAHDYAGNLTVCGAPIEVTFTVTDACNNKSTTKATVKVVDNVAPTLTKKAQSVTVECSANTEQALENWLANHAGAEAKDSCSIVTWTNDYVPANFVTTCGNAGSVTVIFTAKDSCDNVITTTATFTIEDTTAPKFVGQLPVERMTVSCDVVPATPILVATDNCGEAVISFSEKRVGGLCANSYDLVRVWIATDSCGNAISFTQTITVEDKTAPVFVTVPQNVTVECDGQGNKAAYQDWLTTFGNAVATDNCSDADKLVWTTEIVNTSVLCGKTGNTVVKFIVTDECGNASSKQATFTIVDTIKPEVITEATPLVLECGTNVNAQITTWLNNHGGAEASDACGSVTWTHNYNGLTAACGNTGSATVVFTATDSCGNTETTSATITVEDTLKPTLLKEAQGLTVQCGTTTQQALENWLANHAGAEATDSCSTVTWTNDYVPANFVSTCGNAGSVKVIFTATDACGNEVTTTATFTVEDNKAPKFVGTLPVAKMTVSCDVIPATPILVATDNCGEAVISFTEKKVGGLCANSYDLVRVWTATDSCGNATNFTQTITVEDKVAPTFVENLPVNVTVSCSNDVPTAAILTAEDNCGTADVVMTEARVDSSCVNNYVLKRTWVATDACGNSTSHTQIIRVEDKIAPTFVGDLPANITVSCLGDLPADTTVTATDNCGVVDVVLKETRVDGACANSFVLTKTWTATDECGNSVSHTQIITVDDKVAPVFVTVPQNVTVECDGQGNEADFNAWMIAYADAEAADNCSTDLTWTTEIGNTSVLCGKTGSTVVKFTVTDECGNSVSKQAVFTIVDTIGPNFNAEAQDKTVACDGNGNANDLAVWLANHGGAKANDVCSNGITWTNDFTGLDKACGSTGSATVTFTATDSCGNASETTAVFTIVDNEAPVFTTNLPHDLTLECSAEIPEAAVVNAVDACSTAEVVFTEERINGACLGSYQLVRTWKATDSCGNATSHVQTITIEDTTAPVFVDPLPVRELYMSCEDLHEAEELKAIDSCGTVDVTLTEETIAGDCSNRYTLVRTWTATDSCGNATEFVQEIHVACKIEFTNAISANGDGVNDEFQLKGIECYPGNTVEIFNRWGKLVYSTTNYNSNGNVFKGYANTKHVVSGGEKLPTGTYFYVVKYDFSLGNGTTQAMDQSGYIHLESNK